MRTPSRVRMKIGNPIFVFEILDLFAKRWLGKKESFRGSCNVGCLSHRDNVLQMPELYEI
jgi:hypothetical protein